MGMNTEEAPSGAWPHDTPRPEPPSPGGQKTFATLEACRPAIVEWQGLSYSVPEKKMGKKVQKLILDNLSGYAEPGTLTAILGASGSGKSSLLNAIADRVPWSKGAELSGALRVNGAEADEQHRARCAYLLQTEACYPWETVKDTVEFAARMRMAGKSVAEKKARAAHVIAMLGLGKTVDTRVGDGNRVQGVSGGERKRVAMACEMVEAPSVLLLDEPTSGLDSHQALNVVRCLKDLASSGRTVICSIHQPGSAIYALFDRVVVLAEGRCAFFGPAPEVLPHFEGLGLPCPNLFNPADHLLAITSISHEEDEAKEQERLASIYAAAAQQPVQAPETKEPAPDASGIRRQTGYMEQFSLLFSRCLHDVVRNKFLMIGKVMAPLSTALIMILLYKDMGEGEVVAVITQNLTSLLFFLTINGLFGPLFGSVQAFAPEVAVVLRERSSSLYSAGPYYFAKLLVALPVELVPLLITASVIYWALPFSHGADNFLVFAVLYSGMAIASVSLAFVLAVASNGNAQAASAAIGPLAIIMLLLGGFYINTETIPDYVTWISKISYLTFTFKALCINEYADRGISVKDPPAGQGLGEAGLCVPGASELFCADGNTVLNGLFNNGDPLPDGQQWASQKLLLFFYVLIWIGAANLLAYLVLLTKGPKYVLRKRGHADVHLKGQ